MKRHLFLCAALLSLWLSRSKIHAGSASWQLNPTSGDWNTAANWMPNTVPNGPSDIATFDVSNTTGVSLSAKITVDRVAFNPGTSAFTISAPPERSFSFAGAGVANDSGITQNFVAEADELGNFGTISFLNSATAGDQTFFTTRHSGTFLGGGEVKFFDTSSAGNGTFVNEGAPPNLSVASGHTIFLDSSTAGSATFINKTRGGTTQFVQSSTAANGTFTNEGGADGAVGGTMSFEDTSSAGNGTFITNGSNVSQSSDAKIEFFDFSTADHGTLIINGGTGDDATGGIVIFANHSNAADGLFIVNGSSIAGAKGGELEFFDDSNTANATITVNGGEGGGECVFFSDRRDGTAQVEVFGNGTFSLSGITERSVMVGSIEGNGIINIFFHQTLAVGSSNLSTLFSGVIQDLGALEKIGTGTLTLTGENTYEESTTVSSGTLLVSNTSDSGTGTGPVQVDAGTLGGRGIIAGAVTVGTGSGAGAFLAPAAGRKKQATLTCQSSLTLQADATYTCSFKARRNQALSDEVIANGVTISGATINLQGTTQGRVRRGTVFTVISNTSANPISGNFSNLADGAIVSVNGNNLRASYSGGDGNDLTLTVVP
jgi:autotransporter-associated beta strand protein